MKASRLLWFLAFVQPFILPVSADTPALAPLSTSVQRLDGEWLLAVDPANAGREQRWFAAPRPEARPAKVPWIIQDAFPDYNGVAWYWREFTAPRNPHAGGRYLLRFWAVDYQAEVWLNDVMAGTHEGGESPFVLDVTRLLTPGAANRLAVRVLNPTLQPIDGIALAEIPHRNKSQPYTAGSAWNLGGIMDSVELLVTPAVRVEEVWAQPDWKTGVIRIETNLRNAGDGDAPSRIHVTAGPAAAGETVAATALERELPPGDTRIAAELRVPGFKLWELNDPQLYRVTVRVQGRGEASSSFDERAVRCGFRDFRFENGYFRLNGRRLFLRCSHTGNAAPIGLEVPHDPDLLRRDLLLVKVMGFNAIRFIAGVAKRYQLDLCDEIGLMVYEEAYAAWCLADSPAMGRRYDESTLGMVRRDRNHPSVIAWGLLNETSDGPVFRHALAALPKVRALDPDRLVFLNSGAWHESGGGVLAGIQSWRRSDGPDPNVTHNPLATPLVAPWATWAPGQLALHPGPKNEFSVVRWTAPAAGAVEVRARFFGPQNQPTTDLHVLHRGRALFDGWLNLRERGNAAAFTNRIQVAPGDPVDFVVGPGNGNYGGDTTALEAVLRHSNGTVFDAAAGFRPNRETAGPWDYGWLPAGPEPVATGFTPYPMGEVQTRQGIGALSNPGSTNWEDVLSDQHPYQAVPHTADIVRKLRTMNGGGRPLFISEYGIGSGLDLLRISLHYERLGKTEVADARYYRDKLNRFLADWDRWRMAEAFGRPEDYFTAVLAKMAGQRLLGLNAIRANSNAVGHSLTGTVDQGMSGEGLYTTWRELKPGTIDALADGWAPLRWCLFVEPVHFYRGTAARFEAVLANEDHLPPGDYPARLAIIGPQNQVAWSCRTKVTIAPQRAGDESPFALPVLSEEIIVDGPPGPYRFVAAFERGAAPAGGETTFYVGDQAALPQVGPPVTLWGEDADLARWLAARHIPVRAFTPERQDAREILLAGSRPPAPGGAAAFRDLARRVARGSTALMLQPEIFAHEGKSGHWLPLAKKAALTGTSDWLYHKDEWAKPHPAFDGLPTGLLDYTVYRELIPHRVWTNLEAPDEAICGANNTSFDYSSGMMLSAHRFGAGRFLLNTLHIRENLERNPAADRLLVNLLRYAGRDMGESLAHLSPDFEATLGKLGY